MVEMTDRAFAAHVLERQEHLIGAMHKMLDTQEVIRDYALNLGVSERDLKEIVLLTTVHAGFPRAIEAAVALTDVFRQHRAEVGSA
jgi:alkylhydroperoxidase/carboxymuconolactone decarboxylase family protein YurZ